MQQQSQDESPSSNNSHSQDIQQVNHQYASNNGIVDFTRPLPPASIAALKPDDVIELQSDGDSEVSAFNRLAFGPWELF